MKNKNKKDSRWWLFLVSIGFLIIMTSPTVENSTINIIMGVVLVVVGFYFMKRKKG